MFLGLRTRYAVSDFVKELAWQDPGTAGRFLSEHPCGVHVLGAGEEWGRPSARDAEAVEQMLLCLASLYEFVVVDAHFRCGEGAMTLRDDSLNPADSMHTSFVAIDGGESRILRGNDNSMVIAAAPPTLLATARTFVVEGGISLFQLADLLSLPESEGGFGCDVAINLDGGPSTQAVLRAGSVHREIAGGSTVQNVLIVSRKPGR